MNFITRNLWWLLLLGFFIFMLFVISSNDPTDSNGSWTILELSWATVDADDDLQELVDKINTEDEVINSESMEEELMSDEVSSEENEEKVGFFARLFWKNDSQEEWTLSGETLNNEDNDDSDEKQEISETRKPDLIVEAKNTKNTSSWKNLVKNSWTTMSNETRRAINKYAPEMNIASFPWVNLETAVWNTYDIGVHSLKINNKSFTKKLGYMMKWDTVEQVGNANSYGCFEMVILSSKVSSSVGKSGYVCKKYLTESVSSDNVMIDEASWDDMVSISSIWDIIEVTKEWINFAGVDLISGDMLDQMSDTDADGCYTAIVYASENSTSLGKVWTICNSELY